MVMMLLRHISRHIGVVGKKLSAGGSPDILPCGVTLGDVSELSQTPLRHRLMAAETGQGLSRETVNSLGEEAANLQTFLFQSNRQSGSRWGRAASLRTSHLQA